MRFLASLALLTVSLTLIGCGGSDGGPRLPTVPVKGKLLVDDKPFGPCTISLTNSTEILDPKLAAASKTVTGVVGKDGTFVLTTYKEGDGAPLGSYNVSISADFSKMQMDPVPLCKPITVEIAKATDGKPLEIEVKMVSTGETTLGGIGNKVPGRD